MLSDGQVLTPQLNPLTEPQLVAVCSLQQSSQQAEDALSQGLNKLQQTLSEAITPDPIVTSEMTYMAQMTNAMERLDALASFVIQVDSQFSSATIILLSIFLSNFHLSSSH